MDLSWNYVTKSKHMWYVIGTLAFFINNWNLIFVINSDSLNINIANEP